MNILIISNALPFPLHDGDRLILFNLLKNLSKFHQIDLLTFLDQPNSEKYNEIVKPYCRNLVTMSTRDYYSPLNKAFCHLSLYPYSVIKKFSEQMGGLVKSMVEKNEYDIIHFHHLETLLYGLNIDNVPKIAYVIDAVSLYLHRNYHAEKRLYKKFSYFLEFIKMKRYEKRIYPKFDRCVVVSETDRLALEHNCPGAKIVTIMNGVDTEYFNSTTQEEECPSLLFSGNMDYPPNVHAALWFLEKVWPRVKATFPGVKIYLVGRNPSPELKRFKEDSRIIITGFVEDVRPYFDRATIYVCPMLSGTGIKNKLLEAMAMGKAIIASSMSLQGISDVIDRNCLLIADTPSSFSEKIIELLKNRNYRNQLGIRAREFVVNRYSWKSSANVLEQTYLDAIDKFKK